MACRKGRALHKTQPRHEAGIAMDGSILLNDITIRTPSPI